MAKAIKFEATLPDGSIAKRSSKSKVYSHCVAVRYSYEGELFLAKVLSDVDRSNYDYYKAYVDGTSQWIAVPNWAQGNPEALARHAESVANEIARAKKRLEGCESAGDYQKKCVAERVAVVEDRKARGFYDKYFCVGWQSRLDLALKIRGSELAKDWIAAAFTCDARQVG